jgi:hypothetical protein
MENVIEVVIRLFIYKLYHIWREWVSAVGGEQGRKSLNVSPFNEVEILYRSKNFLVINKRHDIVINSDDPAVKVCYLFHNKPLILPVVHTSLSFSLC